MLDGNNLPPGINQDRPMWNEEPKMRACGCGKAYGRNEDDNCPTCLNTGLVEISFEEIIEEKERKKENKAEL